LFGSYTVAHLLNATYSPDEAGLFFGDDLPKRDPEGYARLQAYARQHHRKLLSRHQFVRHVFLKVAYDQRGLVAGFNLPFDLSRIAVGANPARKHYSGGFSLRLDGDKRGENRNVPRIRIKTLDSKRSFIAFSKPLNVPRDQLIPDGASDGRPRKGYVYQGRFLDLRTLAFALTDRGHSLASACKAFGVTSGKSVAEEHGVITPDYIAYNEQDVTASLHLLNGLKVEFDRHPIDLLPDKAYSPASIAKAYLDAMNVTPALRANAEFPPDRIGQAMSAYYGGRAECRIRKTPVPVVYADYLSMYPTVNSLLGTWDYVTAERLEAVDATDELQALLDNLTLDDVFDPATWPRLAWFGEIQPSGDIVPVRASYDDTANGYQIGVNPLTSILASWYAGPDLVASKLLAGRAPRLQRAWKLVPRGKQTGLKPLRLRGQVPIDPANHDFFRRVIETRKSLNRLPALTNDERDRLNLFLKVLANSGGYGIFAEINPNPHAKPQDQRIHAGIGSWTAKAGVEQPGRYSFPPLAALITASARLMLALLEQQVTTRGGTYAMCDTDSMAIVANQHGGLVPCEGGNSKLPDARPAILALTWKDVIESTERFATLNPYDATAVAGSVLEIEKENYGADGKQKQLHAYAVSAKRYALYNLDPDGRPQLRKWSEHGLGHLINPTNPAAADRNWIRQLWQGIIDRALDLTTSDPEWLDRPALTRRTVTRPSIAKAFRTLNRERPYADQVKPFNFILSAHVAPLGHPTGVHPTAYQPIAPYEADPHKWLRLPWTDVHTGQRYNITTTGDATATTARVQTYRDVLQAYEHHPEVKSTAADGTQADQRTAGLLGRLHVHELERVHTGKEANRLEDVDAGSVHDLDEVLTSYGGPGTDAFTLWIKPILVSMPAADMARACGFSVSYAHRLKSGRVSVPRTRASRKRWALAAAMHLGLRPSLNASFRDLCQLVAEGAAGLHRSHEIEPAPAG